MKIVSMVGIFLTHKDEILMIRRSETKAIAPGLWAVVGGHMEKQDFTPSAACLRELKEETGILKNEIEGLNLRYIVFFKTEDTLQVYYDFEAICKQKKPLPQTDEGSLHWVKKDEILTLPMHFTMKHAFIHYLSHPFGLKTFTGIARTRDGVDTIDWQPL